MKKTCFVVAMALSLSMLFANGSADKGVVKAGTKTKIWPRTPPVVYVGFGAGGGTDTAVRPVVLLMEKYLGETINVVNQAGAASALAANNVMNKPHDGYSMFATGSGSFSGFRVSGTSKTYWKDWVSFHPFTGPAVLLVRSDSPVRTYDDAIKFLKSHKVNFAISGFGVGPHVLFEAIIRLAGVSSPNYMTSGSCNKAAVSVISGDAEMAMGTFGSVIDFVKAGQLRAIVITSKEDYTKNGLNIPSICKLQPGSDDIPMLSETWPVMMPRDAPKEIIDKVTEAFKWAVQQPEIKEYADKMGFEVCGFTGEEADKFYALQESGYSWTQWNAGMVPDNPEKLGIPKLEDFNWDVLKKQIR